MQGAHNLHRYLTKICHQIMALISPDHASRIVWNNAQDEEMDASEDEDDDDRLFAFEVSKTKEQDEDVQSRPGFSVSSCSGMRELH
jgi:hypothetical protein